MGSPGEVLVLDMGEQVKIVDLARTLITMADRPEVEIAFTGLRPGEKLSEDLFSRADLHRPTAHALVMATDVPPLGPAAVRNPPTRAGVRERLVELAVGERLSPALHGGLTGVRHSSPGSRTDLIRSISAS